MSTLSNAPSTTVTELTADAKAAVAVPAVPPSQDAAVRERCALLGIPWLDKAPSSDPAAAELLAPEIAVRLGAVPIAFDRARLHPRVRKPRAAFHRSSRGCASSAGRRRG